MAKAVRLFRDSHASYWLCVSRLNPPLIGPVTNGEVSMQLRGNIYHEA